MEEEMDDITSMATTIICVDVHYRYDVSAFIMGKNSAQSLSRGSGDGASLVDNTRREEYTAKVYVASVRDHDKVQGIEGAIHSEGPLDDRLCNE